MPPVDFSAELILVCNSLDAGGIERVVSTLANEWSRRGRKVSVVSALPPDVSVAPPRRPLNSKDRALPLVRPPA